MKYLFLEEKVKKKKLNCLFCWKAKICLRGLPFCVVDSAANSFGTTLDFAAFRSGVDAKYSRASTFSVHNHGFCGGPNRFSQEKHEHDHLSRKKK